MTRSRPDHRIEFDRLFLAAVRGGAASSSVQIQQCVTACANALRAVLATRDIWILTLGPHSKAETEWSIEAFLPPDVPPALRQYIGRPISEILDGYQYWVYRIPLYSTGDSRLNYSEYRLLMPKTRTALPPPPLAALLDHATTLLGHVLPLYQELAVSRHAKPFLHRTVFARSADDYPAYHLLKACKTAVPCWRSLSFWHVSRTDVRLERVAQEPVFKPASCSLDALYGDGVNAFPAVLCIERSASRSGRTELLVRAFASRDRSVFETRRQTISLLTPNAAPNVLHVYSPDAGNPNIERQWSAIEALCGSLLQDLKWADDDSVYIFFNTRRGFERHRAGGHTAVVTAPDADQPADARPALESESHTLPFAGVLVCHAGPGVISPTGLQFVSSLLSQCVAVLDGFSHLRLAFNLWSQGIGLLERARNLKQLFAACEFIVSDVLQGSDVVAWRVTPSAVTLAHASAALVGLNVRPDDASLRHTLDDVEFFGAIDDSSPDWLAKIGQRFAEIAAAQSPIDGPPGQSSAASDDDRPRLYAVSAFVLRVWVDETQYVFAFLRPYRSRRRAIDVAFCAVLPAVLSQALSRLDDVRGRGRRLNSSLVKYRASAAPAYNMEDDFCRLLAASSNESLGSMLFHLDVEVGALTLIGETGCSPRAEAEGRVLDLSEPTFACLCARQQQPYWGEVDGPRITPYVATPDGLLGDRVEEVANRFWLPGAKMALALPISFADTLYGVAIIAWRARLQRRDRRRSAFGAARVVADHFAEVLHERHVGLEWHLLQTLLPACRQLLDLEPSTAIPRRRPDPALPPELDHVFPAGWRTEFGTVLSNVATQLGCTSISVRAADHFRRSLHLLAYGGVPSTTRSYPVSPPRSLSAYSFQRCGLHKGVSLPRILDGRPAFTGVYKDVAYDHSRASTKSCLCIPLESAEAESGCLGTINFESAEYDGFRHLRRACGRVRDAIQDVLSRRLRTYSHELHHQVQHSARVFAQEHHALKDRFDLAAEYLRRLLNDSGMTTTADRATWFLDSQNLMLRKHIDAILGGETRSRFDLRKSLRHVLAEIRRASRLGSPRAAIKIRHLIHRNDPLPIRGNDALFERAVRNTFTQILTFLAPPDSGAVSHSVYAALVESRRYVTLHIGHNGPALPQDLEAALFWYPVSPRHGGTGHGLALAGAEFRAMKMYPRAATARPPGLPVDYGLDATTWLSVTIASQE
jgi:hypothetical protein